MLISLLLDYKKCGKCSISIYLEGLVLRVNIKLRNALAYTRDRGALLFGFYGIL